MLKYPVSLHVARSVETYMKYAQIVFKVYRLGTLKMAAQAVPYSHLEIGYNWEHTIISDELMSCICAFPRYI